MRPRATDVKALDDFKLLVMFSNGEKRLFDVKPYFDFISFKELRNPNLFKNVYVAGLSVEWPSGIDICPDELYYDSVPVQEASASCSCSCSAYNLAKGV